MKRKTGHIYAGLRRRVGADDVAESQVCSGRSTRRKLLIALGAGAFAAPLAAFAQGKVYSIVVVAAVARSAPWFLALEQRLRELGYVEGKNLRFEFKSVEGDFSRYPAVASEVKQFKPDVVIAAGSEFALKAMRDALGATPIVMIAVDFDPVERGYVKSLARPGSNITGIYAQYTELAAKRMELLTQALPKVHRVGVLYDASTRNQFEAVSAVAPKLKVTLLGRELKGVPYDFDAAIRGAASDGAQAIMLLSSGAFFANRAKIAEAAQRQRLPVAANPNYIDAGVLLAHGPSFPGMYRRAAEYADRILKGANPADLPVEQPTQYELVVNMKTAKALGITIPQSVLIRADKVIE